ncbi:MAG: winged helix-turn-helix domain-containing protein [Burkholderiaceae bacterium]|nr:winged helix-turn-helix domain-containing protein [Burkholderiaceae bacterium]
MPSDVHRFAAFELNPSRRALYLEGREVPLQPRVFDLLRYLVEHRDRVVSKEELLDALWPGMVVTESSLQRAVSLARSALQQGGLGDAIRNYSRRGYRFQVEEPGVAGAAATGNSARDEAERAYADARWHDAMNAFARADALRPLDADALERWSIAAQCAGDLAAAAGPLERAALVYSSRGEREAAARVLIGLARIQIESLDLAVPQGCLRRAERLLSDLPKGEQHGNLAWMTARYHLNKGEFSRAIQLAQEARDIGHALSNADIESMGIMIHGIGLQASGDTEAGLALQDEAAAAVVSGNVSPLVGGIVYCGMISSCCNVGDWQRAGQWTDRFTRWCERSNIDTFAGACLVHQAEIYAMSGKLEHARDTICRADPLVRLGAPWALGDAYRLTGDLHLALGDLDEAERCFQHAYRHGWDPYPGYAELLHLRGRGEEAVRGLERAELAWLDGQTERAQHQMHAAREVLQQQGAVIEAARIRLRLAELLARQEDHGAALMELSVAESVFQAAGAWGYLDRCLALRGILRQ